MSNEVHPILLKQSNANEIITVNNNNCKKKKKLNLTNELLESILKFKHLILLSDKKISFLDPVKRDNPKFDFNNTKDIKRVLHYNIETLQGVLMNERSYKKECITILSNRLNVLHQLNDDKENKIKNLERLLADKECVIKSLQNNIENINCAYETLKTHQFNYGEFIHTLVEIVEKLKLYCSYASKITLSQNHIKNATPVVTIVKDLCLEICMLVADIKRVEFCCEDEQLSSKTEFIETIAQKSQDVIHDTKSVQVSPENLVTLTVNQLDENNSSTQTNNFLALLYGIQSMYQNNRVLENTADVLDNQMESLQTNLSDVTTEYLMLSASKSEKMNKSVILDDFCAVTEEITVQQKRNLEFGRILADDNKLITEDLNKIEQLKSKISRKNMKKHKIIKETISVKNQLEVYINRYEELERRKAFLTDSLTNITPGNLTDLKELQSVGSRAKHLKHLKLHYNKLTNKRNALKMRLLKHQEVERSRNPVK